MKTNLGSLLLVLAVALFLPWRQASAAAYTNDNWAALANTAGTNGAILALAVDDVNGKLYVGGDFTTINGVAANRVAVWNGTTWSALGTGTSGPVHALVLNGSDLYAGGSFVTAGGVTVNHIAKWNTTGSAWSSLGTGVDVPFSSTVPYVTALAAGGGNIYAAGDFVEAGGVTVNYIAKWNGTAWSALGAGIEPYASSYLEVEALAVIGSDVYVGGVFQVPVGPGTAYHLARWNGTAWSDLGAGLNGTCWDLAVSGSDLYAAFGTDGFAPGPVPGANSVARWNGSAWSTLNDPAFSEPGLAQKLAVHGSRLYAISYFDPEFPISGLFEWNGTVWTAIGGAHGKVHALALDGAGRPLLAGGEDTVNSIGFDAGGSLQEDYALGYPEFGLVQPPVSATVLRLTPAPDIAVQQFEYPEADYPSTHVVDGTGTIDFGTVEVVNSVGAMRFWISNTGQAQLDISSMTIDGAHASEFTVVSAQTFFAMTEGFPTTLHPGFRLAETIVPDYVDVLVEFTPGAAGVRNAVLHVVSNVAGSKSSYDIALTGVGGTQHPDKLRHSIPAPPTGAQSGAQLGHSVAVDGGYTVVGARLDALGGQDSGVVKVFDSSTGALLFLLPNPGPAFNDQFGHAVAISGTRVVVGACRDDTGGTDAGSAYVYDLTSGTPTVPVHTLNNPGPAAGDQFGWSVAISGTRVVIGANQDDTGAFNAGSAYVYDLSSGTPTTPMLTFSNPVPEFDDKFGQSVSISNMLIVVGASGYEGGDFDDPTAGAAYVYDLSSATPAVPVASLQSPGAPLGDFFGWSVAISGMRVVVGAFGDDTGAFNAGSAYVFDLSSATPATPVATLNNPSPALTDNFGHSVAISGTRVVVGALWDDTGATDAGSAYVYDLGSGTPTVPVHTLNNPGPAVDDYFGTSVAISGTRVVVGAPRDDTGATNAGSAYVYDLSSGTPTVPVAPLNNPGPSAGDEFGTSVAISGTWMVVGAAYAGSAYVYDLSSGTPTVPVATLNNPGPAVSDFFGTSVAISGTRVVVGAIQNDTGATDAGSAYVYDLSSGTGRRRSPWSR